MSEVPLWKIKKKIASDISFGPRKRTTACGFGFVVYGFWVRVERFGLGVQGLEFRI